MSEPSPGYSFADLAGHYPPIYETQTRAEVADFDPISWTELDPPPSVELQRMLTADPSVYGDRSAYAMKVAVAMLHYGYDRETVAGALIHPDNAAAEHCLEQSNPTRAARRIASKARAPLDVDQVFPVNGHASPHAEALPGQILFADQQIEYFKGCTYVSSQNAILMPDGRLLRQAQFDAVMGGYDFYLGDGVRKLSKTDSAWKAFTQGWRFRPPRASYTCFRPKLPPGTIVDDGLLTAVNRYVPPNTRQVDGDASPFLVHMGKLLPDEHDRKILMSYLASILQNPGTKMQWWPVVQGTEGNGKTIFGNILAQCVGWSYFHIVNAAKSARRGINFNGWVDGKLVVVFEEIQPGSAEFLEELKPLVTNEMLNIEGKGVNEGITDNFANGLIVTNYKEAVPIHDNQRRYCPLYTAQQQMTDMQRDGLTAEYWVKLYDWLRYQDGYAIINHFLRHYELDPDYDPAQRAIIAPQSTSTAEAIVTGRSRETQEVVEAIESQEPGFRGGWVSSFMLTTLLTRRTGRSPSPQLVARIMTDLGYRKVGRTDRTVRPDLTRTTLFACPEVPDLTGALKEDLYERCNVV